MVCSLIGSTRTIQSGDRDQERYDLYRPNLSHQRLWSITISLTVYALIGSCDGGDRRIEYFACKGANCLEKYIGDVERQFTLC